MPDRYTPQQRRDYMAKYRAARLTRAVEALGGRCARCGATEGLQFDHIDRRTKFKAITTLTHASKAVFEAELAKCQLLCDPCHRLKTIEARDNRQKLTMDQAREIRGSRSSLASLAAHYGVSPRAIGCVLAGTTYKETPR